ncbi:hypothetical protein GCM10009785_33850 [Brooklawnia cerclae]|uniref:Uncharacterized protein n=1 Tax=Brooklawnia cerclae TaxID=349934 RepID=A0ABX0SG30_9ACTN|nr:hypothetical protein [Brooklawnia cerclae]NIH55701.1 hypothetical protein [Brooklawnia cerclae]
MMTRIAMTGIAGVADSSLARRTHVESLVMGAVAAVALLMVPQWLGAVALVAAACLLVVHWIGGIPAPSEVIDRWETVADLVTLVAIFVWTTVYFFLGIGRSPWLVGIASLFVVPWIAVVIRDARASG